MTKIHQNPKKKDQNNPKTYKMTKIPLKPKNDKNTPKALKKDQNNPKIYKMTKMPLKPKK